MLSTRRRAFFALFGGVALILATAATAAAQSFPTRPIRLIVPYPPGGGTDIVARVIGQRLQQSLGQPIVIDNRGGAGGTLGTAVAAKAAPDGYTMVLVPTSHVHQSEHLCEAALRHREGFRAHHNGRFCRHFDGGQSERARGLGARFRRGGQGEAAGNRQLRFGRCRHRVPSHWRTVQAVVWPAATACALSQLVEPCGSGLETSAIRAFSLRQSSWGSP